MIVTWHVDDLKVSHKESKEVTKFSIASCGIYGAGQSVTLEKVHSYLGVDFDYSTEGTIKLSMIPYSKQVLENFPELIISTAPISALLVLQEAKE